MSNTPQNQVDNAVAKVPNLAQQHSNQSHRAQADTKEPRPRKTHTLYKQGHIAMSKKATDAIQTRPHNDIQGGHRCNEYKASLPCPRKPQTLFKQCHTAMSKKATDTIKTRSHCHVQESYRRYKTMPQSSNQATELRP